MQYLPWANLVSGVWLAVAPVFLNFTQYRVATTNTVVVGLLVAILSAIILHRERAARQASAAKTP